MWEHAKFSAEIHELEDAVSVWPLVSTGTEVEFFVVSWKHIFSSSSSEKDCELLVDTSWVEGESLHVGVSSSIRQVSTEAEEIDSEFEKELSFEVDSVWVEQFNISSVS